ncbi:MFS transporter [Haloterrigena salinisoli]|uniref:MFS transporter n=1 Tax=Haloterrigena salinisoli TaxID=3132747 RepID=UPI0030D1D767
MNRRRAWTMAIFLFVFADAIAMQARGPILSNLEAAFGVSEAALGLVAPAGTIGFLAVVVTVGLLAGRIRVRRALFLGTTLTACALIAMAVAPRYAVFLGALLVQGGAAGVFRGVDRVVLSHLHADRRGRMFTGYAFVWAIGAVLGPQLVTGVLAVADWRAVFVVISLCFLPTAAIAARSELPSMDAERSLSRTDLRALFRRPAVVGACTGMVFVGALEGILFTWLAYYAGTFYGTTTANLVLSAYLLAYVPARLGYTFAIERVPYLALLAAVTLPAVPALAVAFSGVTGPVLFLAVFVAGGSISGGFPTLAAYAVETAPEYSGPLNALTTGATYAGLAIAPPIVGLLAETYGIGRALWSTVCIALALLATVATLWHWTGTPDVPRAEMTAD